jgi:cytochrome c oxidase subunit 4
MSDHDHSQHNQHPSHGDAQAAGSGIWPGPHEHDGNDHHAHHAHGERHVHVIPFKPMFITFVALLLLTVITLWTSRMDFGSLNLFIALLIATAKATLVCAFFMHLKYEKPLNSIVLASTLLGILLFFSLSMLDLDGRGWDDDLEHGEIYTGGRLELHAGQLPPFEAKPGAEARPKAAMNIVDLARQHAEQLAHNEHMSGQSKQHHPAGEGDAAPAGDHSDDTPGA